MDQPPDLDAFNETVWTIVRQVPYGQVTTYGQVASMIPCPDGVEPETYRKLAPRWVGSAMNAASPVTTEDLTVPWHRVINSSGGISLSGLREAGVLQRQKLQSEGVIFNEKEQVDFRVVGWRGPAADFLERYGFLPPRPLFEEKKTDTDKPQQLSLF